MIECTDGARFNSALQKEIHEYYIDQSVQIEAGHLEMLIRCNPDFLLITSRVILSFSSKWAAIRGFNRRSKIANGKIVAPIQ